MSQYDEPLDSGFIDDIARSKARYEELRELQWDFYSELAYQRSKIYDSLKNALRDHSCSFEVPKWQRAVKYRYCLHPLGTKGSLADPGGRFNIGEIDTMRYPVFSALYLASDKSTAFAELLGRAPSFDGSLTPEEIALTQPDSIAVVSVSGHLESVLDISDNSNLSEFVALVKSFRLSASLKAKANKLRFPLRIITTVQELSTVLHASDWRQWPSLYDVPTATQIFGRIALDAQIEGILYKSALTEKPCLAVYPQNFQNSSSYIELDDQTPREVVVRRLDSSNCK